MGNSTRCWPQTPYTKERQTLTIYIHAIQYSIGLFNQYIYNIIDLTTLMGDAIHCATVRQYKTLTNRLLGLFQPLIPMKAYITVQKATSTTKIVNINIKHIYGLMSKDDKRRGPPHPLLLRLEGVYSLCKNNKMAYHNCQSLCSSTPLLHSGSQTASSNNILIYTTNHQVTFTKKQMQRNSAKTSTTQY